MIFKTINKYSIATITAITTTIVYKFNNNTNTAKCDYNRWVYNQHVGKTYTKQDFFKLFPNFKPYKVLRTDRNHFDHIFVDGLNEVKKFNPNGKCDAGGFYLADITDLDGYYYCGDNIAEITLPDSALIYLENNKIKVNKLNLGNVENIKTFNDKLDEKYQKIIVTKNKSLHYDRESSRISKFGIEFISNPSKQIQLASVLANPDSIKFISNPDPDVQLLAVSKNPELIEFISNPCVAAQHKAVSLNSRTITLISNPDANIRLLATEKLLVDILSENDRISRKLNRFLMSNL